MNRLRALVLILMITLLFGGPAQGQEMSEEDLAKKVQNPVSDLISIPFQNVMNFNVGPKEQVQNILNIQPVAPFSLTGDWNLITRTIMPLIWQPEFIPGQDRTFGLGDINFTGFLSPAKPGKLIWGAGPVLLFPSATDKILGSGKWGAGPSAVVLTMNGPWVYGFLVNNIWSFAGSPSRGDVNQMLLQCFINYNLPDGWSVSSAPIITASWEEPSDNRWTVPIGAGVGKILRIGKLPLNCGVQGYYNIEKPRYAADWTLRITVAVLLPKSVFSGGTPAASGE